MGRFYDLFFKRDDVSTDVVRMSPPHTLTPSSYGALMSVDFAACVQTKARSMASLPFKVVYEGRSGRQNLTRHPLAKLLNGMVNEEMSSAQLMDWTVLRRDTKGNAYWFFEWDGGLKAIWPITASVEHNYNPDALAGYRTTYTVAAGDDHVPAGTYFNWEVVNIPTHITKDGVKGVSLAKLAAEQIGLSIDLERFYHSMLRNGNHQLGHLEVPEGRMKEEDLKALRAAVDAKSGVDEAGKTPIFGYGARWVSDTQSMRDASVIEQQQWVLKQVCRACNVPPWKVYENNTTYNGGQQQRIDYVTDTIVPDVRALEMALQPVLNTIQPNCRAKFNVNALMRGDDASRTQYFRELGYIGAITRGDIRDMEDLPPLEGIDRPLFPLNYGTVNEDGSVNVFSSNETGTADGNETGVTNVPVQE